MRPADRSGAVGLLWECLLGGGLSVHLGVVVRLPGAVLGITVGLIGLL